MSQSLSTFPLTVIKCLHPNALLYMISIKYRSLKDYRNDTSPVMVLIWHPNCDPFLVVPFGKKGLSCHYTNCSGLRVVRD
ncbi:hypothetical protein FKM82_019625 [Ascaphus truei]